MYLVIVTSVLAVSTRSLESRVLQGHHVQAS